MTFAQLIQFLCLAFFTFISLSGLPIFILFFFLLLARGLESETVKKLYLYMIIYLICVVSWSVMIFTM